MKGKHSPVVHSEIMERPDTSQRIRHFMAHVVVCDVLVPVLRALTSYHEHPRLEEVS